MFICGPQPCNNRLHFNAECETFERSREVFLLLPSAAQQVQSQRRHMLFTVHRQQLQVLVRENLKKHVKQQRLQLHFFSSEVINDRPWPFKKCGQGVGRISLLRQLFNPLKFSCLKLCNNAIISPSCLLEEAMQARVVQECAIWIKFALISNQIGPRKPLQGGLRLVVLIGTQVQMQCPYLTILSSYDYVSYNLKKSEDLSSPLMDRAAFKDDLLQPGTEALTKQSNDSTFYKFLHHRDQYHTTTNPPTL
ncbi:uncharacterized protein V6R79_004069 [Siganus canaliculatus]